MTLLLLYSFPKENNSLNWDDGFTKAIELLSNKYKVTKINLANHNDIDLNIYDYVIVKDSFSGPVHNYVKSYYKMYPKKNIISIMIFGNVIPTSNDLYLYNILFYQTHWYYDKANLKRHPNVVHAIGIDLDIMKNTHTQKTYDFVYVGHVTSYSRIDRFVNKQGKKIIVTDKLDNTFTHLLKNIEIINSIDYDKLASVYNLSKSCYISGSSTDPFNDDEKILLEARACGLSIVLENDNYKLKELLDSPIYSSEYCAHKIKKAFSKLRKNKIPVVLSSSTTSEQGLRAKSSICERSRNMLGKTHISNVHEKVQPTANTIEKSSSSVLSTEISLKPELKVHSAPVSSVSLVPLHGTRGIPKRKVMQRNVRVKTHSIPNNPQKKPSVHESRVKLNKPMENSKKETVNVTSNDNDFAVAILKDENKKTTKVGANKVLKTRKNGIDLAFI